MMMLLIQKGSDEPDFGSFRVDSTIFVMNFDIIGVNIENKMWALFKWHGYFHIALIISLTVYLFPKIIKLHDGIRKPFAGRGSERLFLRLGPQLLALYCRYWCIHPLYIPIVHVAGLYNGCAHLVHFVWIMWLTVTLWLKPVHSDWWHDTVWQWHWHDCVNLAYADGGGGEGMALSPSLTAPVDCVCESRRVWLLVTVGLTHWQWHFLGLPCPYRSSPLMWSGYTRKALSKKLEITDPSPSQVSRARFSNTSYSLK